MSKISTQSEIDINNVVQRFSKLNVSELELLVSHFNTLIATKKAKSKNQHIKEVTKLIHQSVISNDKLIRYKELVEKLENLTMSEEEKQEFRLLTEEDEKMQNQRIAYMIELAQLRQIPFTQLMSEMGLKPLGIN